MIKNSLLHPVSELHFDRYLAKDTRAALLFTEKLVWERINRSLEIPKSERTFQNTVRALTESSEEFSALTNTVSHLDSVLGGSWSAADTQATQVASKLYNELGLHKGIYTALLEVREVMKPKSLTTAQNKLLDDLIRDYRRGGVALPPTKKQKLKEINEELSKIATKFGQNYAKATDKCGIMVANRAQLVGLGEETVLTAKNEAKLKKLEGYWVQFSEPNYLAVMSQCTDKTTRRAMYKAAKTIGLKPNIPLCLRALELRREKAILLGYKNYADFALEDRMAKNGKIAGSFLDKLSNLYMPTINKEFKELELFAREYENDPMLRLGMADVDSGLDWFYAEKLRNKLFDIDESVTREYFPISKVIFGMFETLSILYGVSFVKNTKLKRWHEDVEVYEISDEADKHIATVWCDWFARRQKHGGAWMNGFFVADRSSGKVEKPHLGYVVANLTGPTPKKPSLLGIREVETIWHEFGHFMHLALGRTELEEQSMQDIEWDFVEAPSQIFENWVWQPDVLAKITSHYKTDKQIPSVVINKLLAARQFRIASKAGRQFILAKTDILLHTEYPLNKTKDPLQLHRDIKTQAYGITAEKWDLELMSFAHIFAGGYAAGYYSYKWAEAIEADFFEKFKQSGVLNPKLGREYRDKVLARGAEVKAEHLVRDFLGRDSNIDAMLRRDGIKT